MESTIKHKKGQVEQVSTDPLVVDAIQIVDTPTTSASTYDILTRNTSTGVVEKIGTGAIVLWEKTGNDIKTNNIGKTFIGSIDTFSFTYDYGLGVSGKIATLTGFRGNIYSDLSEYQLMSSNGNGNVSLLGENVVVLTTDASRITLVKPIKLKSYTVATLPTGVEGDTAYVTDATSPTYLGTLTGGGSVKCPVFFNGTAWVSH